MKKILKIIGIVVAIVIAYCLIAILFFNKNYHGEKSVVINASAENVWKNINSMKAINVWSPWMKIDPNLKVEYSGESGKIGDQFCWDGNDDAGSGCQTISKIDFDGKNGFVNTDVQFKKPFEDKAKSNIKMENLGGTTKVTWEMNFEFTTMMKPMIPIFNWEMNKTFNKGLDDLKNLAEK